MCLKKPLQRVPEGIHCTRKERPSHKDKSTSWQAIYFEVYACVKWSDIRHSIAGGMLEA